MTLKDDILLLREQGKTYQQIVDELGCAKSSVAYHVSEDVKAKHKDRLRDKRNKIRRKLQEIKNETPCEDCGINYPHFVMQFDHLPQYTKLYSIAEVNSFPSMQAFLDEVDKCEIVCGNCHAFRTWARLTKHHEEILDTHSRVV